MEAVFSSSEDRIRATEAKVAVAGPSIVPRIAEVPREHPFKNSKKESWIDENWNRRTSRRFPSFARRAAESFFSVVFPSDCRICGQPLSNISRLPVCGNCVDALLPIEGTVCITCGERIFSPYAIEGPGEPQCGLCRRIEPLFARAVAYGSYETGLRELIHLLKFSGVRPAAVVLGRMLAEAIAKLHPEQWEETMLVIPVPLHRRKRGQRGFNQAELIARAAIKTRACADRLRLCADVLVRKRETASQIGLTSHQRRENLRGAFAVLKRDLIKGRQVLLIDDVYTTGSTVSECSRVLRRAGASKVWVATVARTLKISDQNAAIEASGRSKPAVGTGAVPYSCAASG
jgi:ComF family protein